VPWADLDHGGENGTGPKKNGKTGKARYTSAMTFTPLLLFLLGGAALAQDNARDDARPLSLPGNVGIGVRWEALKADALDAATVQGLFQEDTDGSNVVACGERQYASLWSAPPGACLVRGRDAG
jgi:hypothetical protein